MIIAILVVISILFCLPLVWKATVAFSHYGLLDNVGKTELFVDAYMRGGCNRNHLRLRDQETGRYVDFVKIMQAPSIMGALDSSRTPDSFGPTRFFMQLDSEGCSRNEFKLTQQFFSDRGIDFLLTTDLDPEPTKLIARCDMDIEMGTRLANIVLKEVFGLRDNSKLRVGCYGGLDVGRNAMIGWKGHPQLEEYIRNRKIYR